MTLTFASLNDTADAFYSSITVVSPNTQYVVCNDYAGVTSLSDVSGALALVWSATLDYLGSNIIVEAVDDSGDVWGYDGFADYNLIKVPKSDHTPIVGYTWSYTGGSPAAENGYVDKVFTFTMPDASIFLFVTTGGDGTHYYTATKGVGSTLTENVTTFSSTYAFQDKNGDVWIAGTPTSSSLKMLRITNVVSSAYPNTVQTYTIPDYTDGISHFSPAEIAGAVQGDVFTAAWPAQGLDETPGFSQYLLQVPLAGGAVASTDITSTSVIFPMVSSSNADFKQSFKANLGTIYVQKESTLLDNFDGDIFAVGRTFTAVDLATMTLGADKELDSWLAGDNGDGSYPTQVETNVYLASINAFAGTRHIDASSDLFVYYISEAPPVDAASLRAWRFPQDNHEFYVIQLSALTLVYDKLSDAWSQWKSPDFDYFRGSDGCEWKGINVCCDTESGKVWQIDPQGRLDYGITPITSVVFAGLTERFRTFVPCYMAELAVSEGQPPTGIDASTVGIKLRSGDGLTWYDHGTVSGAAIGTNVTVRWYGIGLMQSPGKVFEITDTGYARCISGFTIETGTFDIATKSKYKSDETTF